MRSRQKVLDATVEIIESEGFDAVSIAAVASRAGVSRQTIYSIFGTREDLVSQAVVGLALTALGDITLRLEATTTPFDYIVELLVAGRGAVRAHPVLATLLDPGRSNPFFDDGMMDRAKPVARQILEPMAARHPEIASEVDDLVDIVLRLGVSVILFDDETVHTDAALRRFLIRWLLPAMTAGD